MIKCSESFMHDDCLKIFNDKGDKAKQSHQLAYLVTQQLKSRTRIKDKTNGSKRKREFMRQYTLIKNGNPIIVCSVMLFSQ